MFNVLSKNNNNFLLSNFTYTTTLKLLKFLRISVLKVAYFFLNERRSPTSFTVEHLQTSMERLLFLLCLTKNNTPKSKVENVSL